MTPRALLVLGAVAVVLATIATVQTAFAHVRPVRFDPPPGAVLQTGPSQVTGWFTGALRRDPNWSFLRVTNADGARVDVGEPILSQDRLQMTVNLQPNLPPGRYTVAWHAWDDADGHILGDCFVFFVGQAAADQAVADRVRLDGGRDCVRTDIAARDGTPVPGVTPTAVGSHDAADDHEDAASEGVAVWVLMLGVAGGLFIGLIGGRLLPR